MKLVNVDTVEQDGYRFFAIVEANSQLQYMNQKEAFKRVYDIDMPMYHELSYFGRPQDLRVLTQPLTITANMDDSSYIQFKFYPGFFTDFASVPGFFRSVIDNDDSRMLAGVLPHDYLFRTHGLPFRQTNKLFHEMILEQGYPRFKSRLAYWAVASPFGKAVWNRQKPQDRLHTRRTAEMHIPRPVKIKGKTYDSLPLIGDKE